ncbi:MAG: Ldh family oxidoreductase [Hyphomicrobiales bacterium]
MSDTVRISLKDGETLVTQAFLASGVPQVTAESVSRALIAAEAEGQSGHGFSRIDDYVAQVRSGKINADAQPETELLAPSNLLTDAKQGFAYPALEQAIDRVAEIATSQGLASVGITNSHHCGALSVQVEALAKRGLVALMVANAPAAIAPWGSSVPVYGTNPIAFAAPRTDAAPLVIDLSLSRVARGKVMHAHKTGGTIPEGWALDPAGNPTTDPSQGLEGTMVPIGDAKGTLLALMVEILASLMTGAATSREATSFFVADGPAPRVGQFILAMQPNTQAGFAGRLEELLGLISSLDGARLPGMRRADCIRQAQQNGLDVPAHYIERVRALAGDAGVPE